MKCCKISEIKILSKIKIKEGRSDEDSKIIYISFIISYKSIFFLRSSVNFNFPERFYKKHLYIRN